MKKIFTLVVFTWQAITLTAQNCNALDPTFGSMGKQIGIVNSVGLNAGNIVVQPDNKIVQFGVINGSYFSIVRYNSNGSVDNSFGQSGVVMGPTGGSTVFGALQGDGKMLVAGNSGYNSFVTRYNANGTADNGFGQGGRVVPSSSSAQWLSNSLNGLAVQPDGKILAVGSTIVDNNCLMGAWGNQFCPNKFTVFRFQNNGNLDSSFGINGKVTTSVGPDSAGIATSVFLQADGKIIVAGQYLFGLSYDDYYGEYYYSSYHLTIVRYNSTGAVDSSFGKNGIIDGASELGGPAAVTLQGDGKILVVGRGNNPIEIERYNSNGSADSSFGINGRQFLGFGWPSSILVLPNNKIAIAGASNNNFLIASLTGNGSFDSSFNGNGKLSLHLGPIGSYDYATSIALLNDHLVVGGVSAYYDANSFSQLILRLLDSIKGLSLIITPRTTLTPCGGGNAKLVVNETGNIRWYKDGNPIAGATDTLYIAYESGSYSAAVENAKGCGLSDPVPVSFNGLPVAITPNGPLNFCEGDSVILTIRESGNIQWYKNNIFIPGAHDTSYTAKNGGTYFALVQNANGCGQSTSVNVNINPVRPPISWDGTNLLTTSSNYTYQWYHNGDPISGANSYILKPTEQGIYKVIVLDYKCNTTSDEFNLNCNVINLPQPSISWNGSALTTTSGLSQYQWYLNGDSIPGAHNSVFAISELGTYKVTVADNFNCQNTSSEFTLSCNVVSPTTPANIWDGKKFTTPSGYAHYQWYQNDTAIAGANSDTYTPDLTQFGFYKVVVTDKYNCTSTSGKLPYFVTALSDIAVGDATLHYYPNPARSVLNIDIAHVGRNKLQVELYDLNGRLVQRKLLNQVHNQLRVDGLSSGLYQLVINNGTEKLAAKIAVIK